MKFRNLTKTGLLLVAIVLSTYACHGNDGLNEYKDSLLAFGTFVEVDLIDVAPEMHKSIIDAVQKDLDYLHYAYHPWKSGPTGRTNQLLAATSEFTANPSMVPLLQKAKEISRKSHYLFNPAIGHLMQVWGYHDEFPPEGPPPEDSEIQYWLKTKPTMDDMTIHGVRISNTNAAVKLDLGAIAKGYALDQVIQHIQTLGVKNAIINAGGDLKVIGKHGSRPWYVGIRKPRGDGVIAGLDVNDGEAVVTSGDYERYYIYQNKRYHHIIDPRTGYPANKTQSVTVIHNDAALADAAATALFVAGPELWVEIANALGIDTAMLIDINGNIHITRKMYNRINFETKPDHIDIVDIQ